MNQDRWRGLKQQSVASGMQQQRLMSINTAYLHDASSVTSVVSDALTLLFAVTGTEILDQLECRTVSNCRRHWS